VEEKVSIQTIKHLCELITAKPYRSGPDLVMFFNQFGWDDTYGEGFPSRYRYVEEKLLDLNDRGMVVGAIEQAIDPRNFIGTEFVVEALVEEANLFLAFDGLVLAQVNHSYKVKSIRGSRAGREPIKNIIFASIDPKPDIVLRDALTNQIEITRNAEHCLVYDRNIAEEGGLQWSELVDWWVALMKVKSHNRKVEEELYVRLYQSIPDVSPPAQFLFRTYYSLKRRDFKHLPALLPEVYLHFDPKTIAERNGKKVLNRQRMDFLLLLPDDVRIVIEVDGKHHYADGDTADPRKYAEMMMEDRDLRLLGYEIYRFGAIELSSANAERNLTRFFERIFKKHRIE
jgi:very-short-patch-repair endonuclease